MTESCFLLSFSYEKLVFYMILIDSLSEFVTGLGLTGDPVVVLSTHVSALVPEIQTITTYTDLRFEEQVISIRALEAANPFSMAGYTPAVQCVTVSNAIGGTFDLNLLGQRARIPYTATADVFRLVLLSEFSYLSDISVSRSDIPSSSRQWTITFDSYEGSLPLMTTSNITLTTQNIGAFANVTVTQVVSGYVQEIQNVTFNSVPLGGQFTLTYDRMATGALAYNASAEEVKVALEGLGNLGSIGVVKAVWGNKPSWQVTFLTLAGDVSLLGSVSNLWAGNNVRQLEYASITVLFFFNNTTKFKKTLNSYLLQVHISQIRKGTSVGVSGYFALTFDNEVTPVLPYSASATDIENALESLSGISDVNVVKLPLLNNGSVWAITFKNPYSPLSTIQFQDNQTSLDATELVYQAVREAKGNTVGGTFTLRNGQKQSKPVAYNASSEALALALVNLYGGGGMEVSRSPMSKTGGVIWSITFPQALGNVGPLDVDSSGLR